MNLSELITKLLIIEKDLIEQGIEVNIVIPKVLINNSDYKFTPITEIEFEQDGKDKTIYLT